MLVLVFELVVVVCEVGVVVVDKGIFFFVYEVRD